MENLILAHKNARRDKKHYRAVKKFDKNPEKYLKEIQDLLKNEKYELKPSDYTVSSIMDKWKERKLYKTKYPHRVVQWAILQQIDTWFNQVFCFHTCASIKWRWVQRAYNLMRKYLKNKEYKYCLKIDISKFYPNVNKDILKRLLRRKFKDKKLLRLLDIIVDSFPEERWIPIWSYLSQYFWNFYLSYFDHFMKEELGIKYCVRYMDDIVVLWKTKEELWNYLWKMRGYLTSELDLKIKDNYQIFPIDDRWIDFIWFRFFFRYTLLRKRIAKRIKKTVNSVINRWLNWKNQTFNLWCSINSYLWWMTLCDSFRFYKKHFLPLQLILWEYYMKTIMWNVRSKKNINRAKKYMQTFVQRQYLHK